MGNFYPFRDENIPELFLLVKDPLAEKDKWGQQRSENGILFLLPLVIDLLENVELSRALKDRFQKDYKGKAGANISEGFQKLVKTYLKEQSGTGNLLRIIEVLKSNGHCSIADVWENFLLRYSLPATSEGSEKANVYSLSRKFLDSKKTDTGDGSVAIMPSSVEQALKNSLILEEMFKKLQIEDQKMFRLVHSSWMKETCKFWRKNARILIHVSKLGTNKEYRKGISLSEFMSLWWENANYSDEQGEEATENDDCYKDKLQDLPFHSYHIEYENTSAFSYRRSEESKFWKPCGHVIEDLDVSGYYRVPLFAEDCANILRLCPNLTRLKIEGFSICTSGESSSFEDTSSSEDSCSCEDEEMGTQEENNLLSTTTPNKSAAGSKKIAEKLHTLELQPVDKESLQSVLSFCPNLKTLTINSSEKTHGALLSPTLTGDFIKLKKLVSNSFKEGLEDFLSLRQYTDILAKNKFDSLEHLEFSTYFGDVRSPPFNIYAALAQTRNSLKSLKWEFNVQKSNDAEMHFGWYVDLSPFSFPTLTELDITIVLRYTNQKFNMKFDFGTLKGLPMLKKLAITVYNSMLQVPVQARNPGAQDWVFEGDRNRYLPTGVIVDYQYSAEEPILCNNLEKFKFINWNLSEEDVKLLSSWFPNLTDLEAFVDHEAMPILLESWQRLEKMKIYTEKLISLRELRPLKEKKKHLQISQVITAGRWIHTSATEMKERNGWLFFE